jgi:hypothetical protein
VAFYLPLTTQIVKNQLSFQMTLWRPGKISPICSQMVYYTQIDLT